MKLPVVLLVHFVYVYMLTFVDLGSGATVLSKYSDDRRDILPPLVPPKLVDEDDDFEERDLDLDRHPNQLHLTSAYWAPTLENLNPGEAEFYRKALMNTIIGQEMRRDSRSMGMLRMGKSSDGVRRSTDGVRRSMTMLRMGRAFDDVADEEEKRSMGMLRMGRGADDDFRKSMSMLRMGRGISEEGEDTKRTMGMLRMGRAASYANKNVDRGALNMLRMGKREVDEENAIAAEGRSRSAMAASAASEKS